LAFLSLPFHFFILDITGVLIQSFNDPSETHYVVFSI